MKKIIKLKNKYGMIVCVLFCMIYFCLGCGQEDETVFLEQKEENKRYVGIEEEQFGAKRTGNRSQTESSGGGRDG